MIFAGRRPRLDWRVTQIKHFWVVLVKIYIYIYYFIGRYLYIIDRKKHTFWTKPRLSFLPVFQNSDCQTSSVCIRDFATLNPTVMGSTSPLCCSQQIWISLFNNYNSSPVKSPAMQILESEGAIKYSCDSQETAVRGDYLSFH